jgi:integrase
MFCDNAKERNRCYDEATVFFSNLLSQIQDQQKGIKKPYNPFLSRLIVKYWMSIRGKKSESSLHSPLIDVLRKFWGRKALDITSAEIEFWWQNELKTDKKDNTIRNILAMFSRVYNYTLLDSTERQILNNPVKKCKKPKYRSRIKVLTPELWERCYSAAKETCIQFANFWLACWETGRRPGEVAQYTWEMTDLNRKIFRIPPEITKTDEPANVPISDKLADLLMTIGPGTPTENVFIDQKGNQWQGWRWNIIIREIRKKVGDDAVWVRDTRRGFITRKTEDEGFDSEWVRAITGQKNKALFEDVYRIKAMKNLRKVVNSTVGSEQQKA